MPIQSALLSTLVSYVPRFITRRLAIDPSPLSTPVGELLDGAILFADISGFSTITEQLAKAGPAGAEHLSRILNDYFGQMIELVLAYGGDVVKFAGDSLLAIWPVDGHGENGSVSLETAVAAAAQCASVIQHRLQDYTTPEGHPLWLRIGIGAGEVRTAHLGGVYGRWEFTVTGRAISEVGEAETQAKLGQVVLTPFAWQTIAHISTSQDLPTGFKQLGTIKNPPPAASLKQPILTNEAEVALRAYIPGAIIHRLVAGQKGWLAELRRVTVLFINLPHLTDTTSLNQAQAVMRNLQTTLYRYEGSVNKISVDDKGATLVAAFGLPPLSHEDDAPRGVIAALAIQKLMQDLQLPCAIGITTANNFCGVIGNEERREYTMIGNKVNLSARLMQASLKDLQETSEPSGLVPILCDQTTYEVSRGKIEFATLSARPVKGFAEPVPVYRPLREKQKILHHTVQTAMVGREDEKDILVSALQQLLRGTKGVIIIEGEAGIGKSRLVADFVLQSQVLGIPHWLGAGDAIEKNTAYHAWRPIVQSLLGLDGTEDDGRSQQKVLTRLQHDPALKERAALLNAILPLNLPENELTAQMSGDVRASNIRDLVISLLTQATEDVPRVLVLEDAHWLDSASWALVAQVQRRVQGLLLVIVTRSVADSATGGMPAEYRRLLTIPHLKHLKLTILKPEEAVTLVCYRLGVDNLPKPVATLIQDQAEGHPFFSEEIAYALRDSGLIRISENRCELMTDDIRKLNFPNTIQGVIISRIDRLTPEQQLALKVASVIGRVFTLGILQDIHPIEHDKPHLAEYLNTLERLDITPIETPEPEKAYIFKHIITQEVAYGLLLYAQRHELHRAAAQWLEQHHAQDLSPHAPLLAYHWTQAEDMSKAIVYLDLAGRRALRDGAYREAVDFLSRALELVQTKQATAEQPRLAQWERLLGEAYYGLGELEASETHLLNALVLLERPLHVTANGRLTLRLLKELGSYLLHALIPRGQTPSPESRTNKLETARIYQTLGPIFYFKNQTIPAVYTAVHGFNLSQHADPTSSEMANSYASLMGTFMLLQLHDLGKRYNQRAIDIARQGDYLTDLSWILIVTTAFGVGVIPWPQLHSQIDEGIETATRLGDRRKLGDSISMKGNIYYFQGQFKQSYQSAVELANAGTESDNAEHQAWGLRQKIAALVPLGRNQEAIDLYEKSNLKIPHDIVYEAPLLGDLGAAYLAVGNLDKAQEIVQRLIDLLGTAVPSSYILFDGYSTIAKVTLTLWEQDSSNKAKAAKAAQACKLMWGYTRLHAIGRARAWLYQGWYDWLNGRHNKAKQAWQKSLEAAFAIQAPYEQALAHYELGRHLHDNDPLRRQHLEKAIYFFTQCEAEQNLQAAIAMLQNLP